MRALCWPLLVLLAALPQQGGLRIVPKEDPSRIEVIAELSKDASALLPAGKVPQETGEGRLQFCLLEDGKVGPPMLGSYVRDGQKLTFIPRFPLQPDKAYRARVLEAGKEIKTIDYQVPAKPETPPPVVVAVWPTTDVLPANHLRFYIEFSRPMRGGSEIFSQISLIDSDGQPVEDPWLPDELWNEAGTVLTLYIHPGRIKWGVLLRWLLGPVLEPERRYNLVIGQEMLDADKRKLAKEYRKEFRTVAEDRTRIDLSTWKLQSPKIGERGPLVLSLPKSIDHVCLERYLTVVDAKDTPVAGKVEVSRDGKSWKFVPNSPWATQEYRIKVDAQLEDPCGNTPAAPFDVDADAPPLLPQPLFISFKGKASLRAASVTATRPTGGNAPVEREQKDQPEFLDPAQKAAKLLFVSDTWAIWQTSELIERTRTFRAQFFTHRFYRQRVTEPKAVLVHTEQTTNVPHIACAMADGTLVISALGMVSIHSQGAPVKRFEQRMPVSALYPNGIVFHDELAKKPSVEFVPFDGHDLAMNKKVEVIPPSERKFYSHELLRHRDTLVWISDSTLHVSDLYTGKRADTVLTVTLHPSNAPAAYDGETLISNIFAFNAKTGRLLVDLEELRHLVPARLPIATRHGIGYCIDKDELLAVDLTDLKLPPQKLGPTKARPIGQSDAGLLVWTGAEWSLVPWLKKLK